MTPDNELLGRYAKTGSEDAFAELVRRHVDLVYSAALRQVGGDAHLAQDVAQSVFAELARKARSLSGRQSLSGWLYTSAHFAAAKIARTEHRRRDREEKFMREPIHENGSEADWEKLRPVLDAAMHELKELDREAILLRFFENHPFAQIGAKLKLNENAARMRVERALDRLRDALSKRGITTTTALASVISANAVQIAPGYWAASLATASMADAGTKAFALLKFMTSTKLKLGVGTLAAAGLAVVLVAQYRTQKTLQAENGLLTQQVAQLKTDNLDLSNRLSAGRPKSLTGDELEELLKLRAEVTRLRAMKTSAAMATVRSTINSPAKKTEEINLKVRFVSQDSRFMPSFTAGWTAVGPETSLVSEQQFAAVLAALDNRGANLINEAQVTTLSGRQASVQDVETVPINGENVPIGAILDSVPFYSSDSSVFTLKLIATLNELTGDPSQPGVRVIQASNQVSLSPGQTVALKADLPPGGWLPDATNRSDDPQNLLVFVTPTIVEQNQGTQARQNQASSDTAPQKTNDAAMQKMNDARQAILALILFANANQDQYPTNLAAASQYLKEGDMDQIASNFDLLAPVSTTNIANNASAIVLREKQSWQSPSGNWLKTYGFADGHVEIHSEPTDNFDDFEKDRIVSAPSIQ